MIAVVCCGASQMVNTIREFGAERKAQCGAVTFIQRFDSALRLNLHLHMAAFDGVYAADDEGRPQFQALFIGYASACPDHHSFTPAGRVRRWIGASGEGIAMLAAAGTSTREHVSRLSRIHTAA